MLASTGSATGFAIVKSFWIYASVIEPAEIINGV